MTGSTVCYMHGGKSPKGIASPSFRHGRYSKYLPARLAERYDDARNDPDALALKDERALLEARLTEVLQQVSEGGSGALWKQAKQAFTDLKWALLSKDTDAMAASIRTLESLLTKGTDEQAAWDEAYEIVERLRRLVDTERRHQIAAQQVITTTEFMAVMGRISALALLCFGEHRDELRRFSDGILALVSGGSGSPVPGAVVDGDAELVAEGVPERGDGQGL